VPTTRLFFPNTVEILYGPSLRADGQYENPRRFRERVEFSSRPVKHWNKFVKPRAPTEYDSPVMGRGRSFAGKIREETQARREQRPPAPFRDFARGEIIG